MFTEQQAYVKALMAFPELNYNKKCIDYKDSWAFPYDSNPQCIVTGPAIFVKKDSGFVIYNDPAFDIDMWNSSEDVSYRFEPERLDEFKKLMEIVVPLLRKK